MKFRYIIYSCLLLIPSICFAQSMDNRTHTVESGDTLWSISRKYYGDPGKYTLLLEYNPEIKGTHRLHKGQVLRLGADVVVADAVAGADNKESAKAVKKRLKPFVTEIKWKDAERLKCTVSVMDAENGLVFSHDFPIENPDYDAIEAHKGPGERKSIEELHFQDRPYSECDDSPDSQFHELELYRLIRKQEPAMMVQKAKIGKVTFKDMNFDGEEDLLIYKGIFGALDIEFYDIYFWDENQQTYVESKSPNLNSVGHVVIDATHKTITYTKQNCLSSWAYYKYQLDSDNHWKIISRIDESCSRTITLGELYTLREEDLEQRPYICDYVVSNSEETDDYGIKRDFSKLASEWQNYIQGANHPQIMKNRIEDYAQTYIRNHTLHFNSVQEMEQWKKENNAMDTDEFRRRFGF